jgi:hypothetical protein
MSNNKLINDEIEKTMQSLNNLEKTEVSPFFFSKLQERIKTESPSTVNYNSTLVRRYSPIAIGLFLLLFVNAYTILSIQLPKANQGSEIDAFLNDYHMFIEDEAVIHWLEE